MATVVSLHLEYALVSQLFVMYYDELSGDDLYDALRGVCDVNDAAVLHKNLS